MASFAHMRRGRHVSATAYAHGSGKRKRRAPITAPCGHCDGTGVVEPRRLNEVRDALRFHEWLTTQEVAAKLDLGEANTANVLRELHQLGVVERRGAKPLEWRLV